jgi:hypothetical protein
MHSRAMHCEFCHRIQEDGPDRQLQETPEELPLFLQRHNVALQELSLYDGLCAQCEGFYRQLVAYGAPQGAPWQRSAADMHP